MWAVQVKDVARDYPGHPYSTSPAALPPVDWFIVYIIVVYITHRRVN